MSHSSLTPSKLTVDTSHALVSPRRTRSTSTARSLDVATSSKSATQLKHNIAVATKPTPLSQLLHTQSVFTPTSSQRRASDSNLSTITGSVDDGDLSIHSSAHSSSHSSDEDLSRPITASLLPPATSSAMASSTDNKRSADGTTTADNMKETQVEHKYADLHSNFTDQQLTIQQLRA